MDHRHVLRALGQIQLLVAGAMLLALPWSLWHRDGDALAIVLSALITAAIGAALWHFGRHTQQNLFRREALAIVGLGWLLSAHTAALPFVLSGMLGPVDAVFEAMSGLTTTGATVIPDLAVHLGPDLAPGHARHGVMFWRSLTHWLGGMGIIVLLVAFLPAAGGAAKALFQSEVTGVSKEGIKPRIRQTALRLWVLYVALSLLQAALLLACGMTLYDALCHTFGTMATGGFSTHNASVAAFASIPVELIILLFMILAGTNFTLHYHLAHLRLRLVLRDPELRLYLTILLVSTALITLDLAARGPEPDASAPTLLRQSSFTVVSIMTTTGFATADFDQWPPLSKTLLLFLMFAGGCAGSTGGGMKVVRVLLLLRIASHQIRRIFNPRRVHVLRLGRHIIDADVQQLTLTFFFVGMAVFAGTSLLLAALGTDELTALTATAACLNNIGPGLAEVGPTQTYATMPTLAKLALTLCMAVGRLEYWPVFCLLAPSFWRQR